MVGTLSGGKKCAQTNMKRHGADYYHRLGKLGGSAKTTKPKGFAANPALAVIAGSKGGAISKRGPAKKKEETD